MPIIETSLRPWPVSQQAHGWGNDTMEMLSAEKPAWADQCFIQSSVLRKGRYRHQRLRSASANCPSTLSVLVGMLNSFPSQMSNGATIVRATPGQCRGVVDRHRSHVFHAALPSILQPFHLPFCLLLVSIVGSRTAESSCRGSSMLKLSFVRSPYLLRKPEPAPLLKHFVIPTTSHILEALEVILPTRQAQPRSEPVFPVCTISPYQAAFKVQRLCAFRRSGRRSQCAWIRRKFFEIMQYFEAHSQNTVKISIAINLRERSVATPSYPRCRGGQTSSSTTASPC